MTNAAASDPCSTRRIHAVAEVQVSDGSRFTMETCFRARDEAAVRRIRDKVRTVAVEGPFALTAEGGAARPGGDPERGFALGHQFHALLLAFDEIVGDAAPGWFAAALPAPPIDEVLAHRRQCAARVAACPAAPGA